MLGVHRISRDLGGVDLNVAEFGRRLENSLRVLFGGTTAPNIIESSPGCRVGPGKVLATGLGFGLGGLKELLVVKDGKVIPLYPFGE
jgi:hypothetical protein